MPFDPDDSESNKKFRCKAVHPKWSGRWGATLIDLFSNGRRGRRGVVAVEFALILPVFLYLLIGILEVSLLLFTTTVVDGAVQDAARRIRTGQAQLSGDTFADFQNALCSSIVTYDCDDMALDVKTFSSFSTVTSPSLGLNEDGDVVDENGDAYNVEFTPGGAGDINVVRVIYSWTFFTPLIGELLGDSENVKLLTSTAVFRNEPYE